MVLRDQRKPTRAHGAALQGLTINNTHWRKNLLATSHNENIPFHDKQEAAPIVVIVLVDINYLYYVGMQAAAEVEIDLSSRFGSVIQDLPMQ